MIARLAASTVAFLLASHFTRRWLDDNDIPKGMTRGALIFAIALVAAYGTDWLVGKLI
jgi:hypothetical protein